MKVNLETQHKYFATTEPEAEGLIAEFKTSTKGDITKQQITKKNHAEYGPYFEITVTETFTTSRSLLENGY